MKAWGLLGPTQLPCSLEEPHKHGAEHKPVGTLLPHAEKGRIQEPIPPICPTPGPWRENQDVSGYNSACTLWTSICSLYHAEQTTGLRAPPYAVSAGIHQPQSEVRCTPGAHTSGARSSEGTRWLMGGGWSSELQHGPPRQSVGQVMLTSPTRQAPGHHKIPPPLYPVSAQPSTAHRSSKPTRVWPQTVAKGPVVS